MTDADTQWAFLDALGDGVYGVDTTGACIFVNAAAVRLLGYDSRNDLLGRNMHLAIHHTRPEGSPYSAGGMPVAAHRNQRPSRPTRERDALASGRDTFLCRVLLLPRVRRRPGDGKRHHLQRHLGPPGLAKAPRGAIRGQPNPGSGRSYRGRDAARQPSRRHRHRPRLGHRSLLAQGRLGRWPSEVPLRGPMVRRGRRSLPRVRGKECLQSPGNGLRHGRGGLGDGGAYTRRRFISRPEGPAPRRTPHVTVYAAASPSRSWPVPRSLGAVEFYARKRIAIDESLLESVSTLGQQIGQTLERRPLRGIAGRERTPQGGNPGLGPPMRSSRWMPQVG